MNDNRTKLAFSQRERHGEEAGDMTEWVYHPGTMALQQKKDATGKGASYTYHPDGTLATRK